MKPLGSFSLVPAALLKHVHDDSTLAILDDVKQGRSRIGIEHGDSGAPAGDVIRQKIEANVDLRREHYGTLNDIFKFAHISRPWIVHERTQRFGRDAPL